MFNAIASRSRSDKEAAATQRQCQDHTELEALHGDAALLHRARELNALRDSLATGDRPGRPPRR
ncbi:MAG: hypothetical protein WCC36_02595 [Gammaproteobacteria bacterium]